MRREVFGQTGQSIPDVRKGTQRRVARHADTSSNRGDQMPRQVRDAALETRTARSRLRVRPRPYYRLIAPGLHLGYRKLASGPGTWIARRYLGNGSYATENLRTSGNLIVTADDYADSDGEAVLNFAQAQDRARAAVRRNDDSGRLLNVKEAIDRYRVGLEQRGGDAGNASRIMLHLPEVLGSKSVAQLAARDFRTWRDTLIKNKLTPATINRINAVFKAALNFAADEDERIVHHVWDRALPNIPGTAVARNVILPEGDVRKIIASAYEESEAFGLFVEVLAITGSRPRLLLSGRGWSCSLTSNRSGCLRARPAFRTLTVTLSCRTAAPNL
jgi:hypothetical protein